MDINKPSIIIDKSCLEKKRTQIIIETILRKIIFSDEPKISLDKKKKLIKNLFTKDELKELPNPIGIAYYEAVQGMQQLLIDKKNQH